MENARPYVVGMSSEWERSLRRLETQTNIAIMVIVAKVACLVVFVLVILYMLVGSLWLALVQP